MTKLEYAREIAELIDGEVREVSKNGIIMTGITPPTGDVRPTVYVDDMFNQGIGVSLAAERIREIIEKNSDNVDINDVRTMMESFESARKYLRLRLVSDNCGYDVFKSAAEEGFDDLILVPYIVGVVRNEGGIGSIRVTEDILRNWGISADEAIQTAAENSNNDEYIIKGLNELIAEMMGFAPDDMMIPADGGMPMYVITNRDKISGAYGVIAMKDRLKAMFPEGYVVLPSSIHECIVLPANEYNAEMEVMVREINGTVVDPLDKLSDNVYVINNSRVIRIA